MKEKESVSRKRIDISEDEVDIIAFMKRIWIGRRTVIKSVILFTFLGLFIALFSPKEYTSKTTMVPQINNPSANLGGLSSLASLAGINMNMSPGSFDIPPTLYPKIVNSIAFQLEIMNTEYKFEEVESKVSLYEYYVNIQKLGLYGILKKFANGLKERISSLILGEKDEIVLGKDSGLVKLTKDQDKVQKKIEKRLSLNVNDKDGYLTFESRFHQAHLSAQIAQKAQMLLQEYVTQIKIEKASAQLEFIISRYEEKKKEFEGSQTRLAFFRDANKNISSALAQTQEERLENEYQLAFDVYSELAKQLEQSRIQVKEDTPIFSVIEAVTIPVLKSKPNRPMILIIWMFFGGVIGIGLVFSHTYFESVKESWHDN